MATTQTDSGQSVIPSTQQKLFINLTAPVETDQSTIGISGYVSRDELKSNTFNIAYVIDTSGSMYFDLQANEHVQDQNSNGINNQLIDGAVLAYEKLNQDLISAGLGTSAAAIIEFNDHANMIYNGLVQQDENSNNIVDINESLQSLVAGGTTNFEDALQKTADFFEGQQNQSENYVFFISDGEPNFRNYLDEVDILLNTHHANIRVLGLGQGANLNELDYVDDGEINQSAARVLEPSELIAGLTASPVDTAEIEKVEIYVNQQKVSTLLAQDLVSTAVGLKYELSLDSLIVGQDDIIEARVIASDQAATVSAANLTVKESLPPVVVVDTETGTGGGSGNGESNHSNNTPSKLFLDKNDAVTLIDNAKVFGASGDEMIKIVAAAGATIDQGVERVEFNEVLANYTFSLGGNVLTVNLKGQLAASITIQGDGTKLAFNDGSADFVLTGLSLGTLGGAFVDNNDSVLNGVQLDTFDPSIITSILDGTTRVDGVNINAQGIDNYGKDNKENAENNDISFYFEQGSYQYTVQNFAIGDSLHFDQNTTLSIKNIATDGNLEVIANDAVSGTSVQVTLTGISSVLDSNTISVNSFTTAFGAESLVL